MRDAAGEKPELLEGLGFSPLRVGALLFCDVAKDQDYSTKLVLSVADRRGHLFDQALGPVP